MAGLQGSGKTTTSAKLGLRLRKRERKKVLLASLDTQRPAAQMQLEVLARQCEVASLPIVAGAAGRWRSPGGRWRPARREGYDVLMLDTAGRLSIDEALMPSWPQVRDLAKPHETLLVADALTGQDAVNTARAFHERIGITGIVLTRMDGDARGGAALSMRHVTGQPIKLVGMGEKLDALEPFHPDRVAARILDMGDVVSLVEKAAEIVDKDEAEKLARKMAKGSFDLGDLRAQLQQMRKMGGMKGILGKLPGVQKMQKQLAEANIDEKVIGRQCAIIDSMTPKERRNADLLNASRKRRIAAGSGTTVQDVNRLLKQHKQMQDMMKRMKKAGGIQNLFGRGGFAARHAAALSGAASHRQAKTTGETRSWPFEFVWRAAAPRSVPTTGSWPPTRAARVTAASSSGWAATIRCWRARTPTGSSSTRSVCATGWARAPRSATAWRGSSTRPASCPVPPGSRHRQARRRDRGQEGRGREGGLTGRRWRTGRQSHGLRGTDRRSHTACAAPSACAASPRCRRTSPPTARCATPHGEPLFALDIIGPAKGGVIASGAGHQ